ncbi:MAG: hypothetical protein IPO87_07515 [Flavobacteriales bacterium]|nr:hypothetical protein [Flavobacteriales bacterium]
MATEPTRIRNGKTNGVVEWFRATTNTTDHSATILILVERLRVVMGIMEQCSTPRIGQFA